MTSKDVRSGRVFVVMLPAGPSVQPAALLSASYSSGVSVTMNSTRVRSNARLVDQKSANSPSFTSEGELPSLHLMVAPVGVFLSTVPT